VRLWFEWVWSNKALPLRVAVQKERPGLPWKHDSPQKESCLHFWAKGPKWALSHPKLPWDVPRANFGPWIRWWGPDGLKLKVNAPNRPRNSVPQSSRKPPLEFLKPGVFIRTQDSSLSGIGRVWIGIVTPGRLIRYRYRESLSGKLFGETQHRESGCPFW